MTNGSPVPQQGRPAAEAAKPGAPADAIGGFEDALVKAAKAAPANKADSLVGDSFALGWQMAELYRPDRRRVQESGLSELRGLDSFDDAARIEILVDQVQAHVAKFHAPIEQAGLPALDLGVLRDSLGKHEEARRKAVRELHRTLLGRLLAVDYRLGKSYGLGRALADICRNQTDPGGLGAKLSAASIANLLGWLDDLSTAFPPYSAHSVKSSLTSWRDRAGQLGAGGAADGTLSLLRRQGELWRALLTGEKRGTEMLEIDNYLAAARDLASHTHSVLTSVIRRFWPLMSLAAALLAGGVALLASGGGSNDVAGASTILVALGLSWKGLGATLGALAGKLEQPLWGAVLDRAIAHAITLLPPIQDDDHDHAGRGALALQMPPLPGTHAKPPAEPSASEH